MRVPVVLGPRALVPHRQEGQEQLLRGNQVGYSIILLGIMNGPIRRMFHTEYLAKNPCSRYQAFCLFNER